MPSRGKEPPAQGGGQVNPPRHPQTPQNLPSGDYSYVLEIVMNMQLSMGKLIEAVDGLKETQKEHGKKLERLSHQVYAAIVVLALLGAVLGYFANSINNLVGQLITNSVQQQQQPTPLPSVAPPKK